MRSPPCPRPPATGRARHIACRWTDCLSQQPGQERYKGHANEGHASARNKLLDSLALAGGIIGPVPLQQIDAAPYTQSAAQAHNDGL